MDDIVNPQLDPAAPETAAASVDVLDPPPASSESTAVLPSRAPSQPAAAPLTAVPQDCGCGGGSNGSGGSGTAVGWVYAIGRVRPAFPNDSVEQEFWAALGGIQPVSQAPDDQLFYQVLSQGRNAYIARAMCWILQIDGVDAYLVRPQTGVELNEIVSSLWPRPGDRRFDTIIGPRGPIAPPSYCNGVQLPLVGANEVYAFTFNEFVDAIVADTGVAPPFAASMFNRMLQLSDNAGGTDEHRAINYVTLRYMGIYSLARDVLDPNRPPLGVYRLTSVTAMPARVQGNRRVVDVVFHYEERTTGEMVSWFCRVDVTGQFPFLVTKLSRYYPGP